MKKYILIALSSILAFTSCYKEDPIDPNTTGGILLRYDFPQGNNEWDKDLQKIADDFGTFVIYDKLNDGDFNRSWTASTGAYFGQSLKDDEQKKFQITFLKDHVFRFLNHKMTRNTFPVYLYLAWNVYTPINWGGTMFLGNYVPLIKTDGMDYWAFCIESDCVGENVGGYVNTFRPITETNVTLTRGIILMNIINKAISKGAIETPKEFSDRIDYVTKIVYAKGSENDPNYFWKRGIIGSIVGLTKFTVGHPTSLSKMTPSALFERYIMVAMKYTREELIGGVFTLEPTKGHIVAYDAQKYPLILEMYDFTVAYLKENYDWDVTQIPANRGTVDVKY